MNPADMLEGLALNDGWHVVQKIARRPTATGGHFSTGYIVENRDGRKGFLKAMDYTAAFHSADTSKTLAAMTSAYLFEKNICAKCSENHFGRVVHAIASAALQTDANNAFSKVEYLIFELADSDIRAHLDAQQHFDLAFALRTLHHVATGLEQLHKAAIAHQDLKPSNVLVFGKKVGTKISDFGRAWAKEFRSAHEDYQIAGDTGYAPPELLYGQVAEDVNSRRYGCDTYHLGSLAVFFFSRAHTNALIHKNLAPEHWPFTWGGTYAGVMPYVQAAFSQALAEFSATVPEGFRAELTESVSYLCEPDPSKRGHPLNRGVNTNQFALDRFISKFDLLATHAELRLMRGTM